MQRLISVDRNVIESHYRILLHSVLFLKSNSVCDTCIIKGICRQNRGSSGAERTFSTELPLLMDPPLLVETNREPQVGRSRCAIVPSQEMERKKIYIYQRKTPL